MFYSTNVMILHTLVPPFIVYESTPFLPGRIFRERGEKWVWPWHIHIYLVSELGWIRSFKVWKHADLLSDLIYYLTFLSHFMAI